MPPASLLSLTRGSWDPATPMRVVEQTARCLMVDRAGQLLPAMAELRLQGGEWVLHRFRQQCAACLGDGWNDLVGGGGARREICDLCFGEGWED